MQVVIPFSAIFPDEKPKSASEYLSDIDRDTLLKMGSFFLGFNHGKSKYSNPYEFMSMFFSPENSTFFQMALLNLERFLSKIDVKIEDVEIPYVVSSLSFFELVFDNKVTQNKKTRLEIEISVFKAYLVLNENSTDQRDQVATEIKNILPVHKQPSGILLALHLHNSDITNYYWDKLFSTQLIRAIMFFEFLSSRQDCKILLDKFYDYYKVKDYKEYLIRILPLSLTIIKRDKEAHTDIILGDDATEIDAAFLDKLITTDTDMISDFDFRNIRANPIYKVSKNNYRIISPLFGMEIVFNGLYWKLKKINDSLPKADKPKDLYGLKTFEFSEKTVLNNVLNDYFSDRFVKITGEELDVNYSGAPDYYVRTPNSITLFESKDIMLNSDVKHSTDFKNVQKALADKLYKKDDGTPKAVMQLINNIKKIIKQEIEFDGGFDGSKIKINPVLILHYSMFNTLGLNKFINFWFEEELKKLADTGLLVGNVGALVIIDIDTLIFNKDVFNDQKLELEDCLSEYQNEYLNYSPTGKTFKNQDEMIDMSQNSFLPFANFLDNKINKKGLRSAPRELMEKGYQIFK
jgi:hypothetical protein